jgi:short-subunit dehydrogenase
MPVAVVTGAGRGLGRKIAERLARKYEVLVTDIDAATATATAAAIGGGAWALPQDVRDPESHRAIARAATARGELEVWVNNAGVLVVGETWNRSDADVRRMIEVNLLGVIWGCHAAIPLIAEGGHILNIGSLSAIVPAPGLSVYAATKHGVLGYSLSLAGELRRAGRRVHVSSLCPDAIAGDMTDAVAHDASAGILFSAGKMLTLDQVADAALELVEKPRLVHIMPSYRAALIHLLRPFPALGLPLLEQFAKLGRRRRARG